jgi:hypothetical protein
MMSDKGSVSYHHDTRAHTEPEPSRDQIQERAYYRYVERGRADGQALDDWLVAETDICNQANAESES